MPNFTFETIASAFALTGLSFIFLIAVFRPLEVAFPARAGQPFWRPAFATDLCFLFGHNLFWNFLVLYALAQWGGVLRGAVPLGFREAVAAQPWLLRAFEVVLLSDLLIYWGHRLQHSVGFLWRFHAVHHSTERLDWLAAHREHPFDALYNALITSVPAYAMGFSLSTLAGFVAFRGVWAVYSHSNVRAPIGPLRWVLGAPELHHWHHHRSQEAGNYANFSPVLDMIFGTYRCPNHEPDELGIDEPLPRGYFQQLIHPLLPARWTASWPREEKVGQDTPMENSADAPAIAASAVGETEQSITPQNH